MTEQSNKIFNSLAGIVARNPLPVLAAAFLLACASLWLASQRLAIEPDVAALLPEDTGFLQDYAAYKRSFPYDRRTNIVVIDAPGADQAAWAQQALTEKLRSEYGALFNAIRAPGYDGFLSTHGLLYLDLPTLRKVVSEATRARPVLARLSAQPDLHGLADLIEAGLTDTALEAGSAPDLAILLTFLADAADDLVAGRPNAVSWAGLMAGGELAPSRRLILAQGRLDGPEETVGVDTGSLIRKEALALGLTEENGFLVRLTGRGPLSAEETNAAISDVQLAGIISFAMLAIILWSGFRSFKVITAVLATVGIGLAWTMGFATIAVGQLNILSLVFAVLFIGLGVDFAIHGALRYLETAPGTPPEQSATVATALGGPALGLCAITSAIGFLAFLPTDYRGLAELGVISAGGMILAYIASITVLPALLVLARTGSQGARPLPGSAGIARLSDSKSNTRRVTVGVALAGIGLAVVASQTAFNFNTLALKDPRSDAISAFKDLQKDGVATAYSLSIAFPDTASAAAARTALEALPMVDKVHGPSDLVPDDQRAKLKLIDELAIQLWPAIRDAKAKPEFGGGEALNALNRLITLSELAAQKPDSLGDVGKRLAVSLSSLDGEAQAIELDRRLTTGIPPLVQMMARIIEAQEITLSTLPEDEKGRYIAPSGRSRLKVLPTADLTDYKSLQIFVEAVSERHPNATGRPKLEYETGKIVVRAFLSAITLALVAISIVLFAVFRRVRDVFLVLTPLGLAGAATLAFSVLSGTPLNMASVVVLPLILGLGVDNGIHFVMRWREAGDVASVLKGSTTRAIVMSGLTTFASFGTLILAGNGAISSMGIMLTVGIASILISMIAILPLILSQLSHHK